MKRIFTLLFILISCFGSLTFGQSQERQIRKLLDVVPLKTGWKLKTSQGFVWIRPFDSGIVEVSFSLVDVQPTDSSHAVVMKPKAITLKMDKSALAYTLYAGDLRILVHADPCYLSFIHNQDTLLSEESGFFKGPGKSGVRFKLAPSEKIYGAGERSVPLDRRGYYLPLYNRPNYGYQVGVTELNYSVPVVLSSKKYAILWDNPQKGYVDIGKQQPDVMEWGAIGGPARYYFLMATDYAALMKAYTNLTGRQELPPRWALGNLQSRMAYRNQKEADSIVRLMQQKNFPIDALILDFYWFGDSILGHLGMLDWYKPAWPDPVGMIKKFKDKGVKTILITEPYVIDSMPNFKIAADKGLFATDSLGKPYVNHYFYFGPGGLLDIFKPEARDWFWGKYKKQVDNGVAAWWGDLGEPESHPSDIHHVNGKADEVHNIYGHYWDRMLYERYASLYPNTRLFHLQRSGFAGSQRYSAYPWTGDVSRSWGGLQAQLPVLLSMSMNGLGYIHSDAGGFAMGVKDEELYARWLQFAAYTPIMRPHGSGIPSEPVFFSDKTQAIVRASMKLRYAMVPYNYTLAWENASTGAPLMRPMYYYHDDTVSQRIQDQYYWGANLMVAPVLEKEIKSRKIYFPAGDWYDFHSGKKLNGGTWVDYPVSEREIPVFAKGGSFVPMCAPLKSMDYYKSDNFTVYYFPGKQSEFTQYEDDGSSRLSMRNGEFELIQYKASASTEKISINISKSGHWKGMPATRDMRLMIWRESAVASIVINGKRINKQEIGEVASYAYHDKFIDISFNWDGKPVNIEISDK